MNCCCENCGRSEIVGSPIICKYNGHRKWRDECCEAWKPKEKETNMVEVTIIEDAIKQAEKNLGRELTEKEKNIVCLFEKLMNAVWDEPKEEPDETKKR